MPGESSAGITSGLLLMLKKVQAEDWESASIILRLMERNDLPNHRELGRVAAIRAKLPRLRAALHVKEKGPLSEAIRAAIEAWEKPTQVGIPAKLNAKSGMMPNGFPG